MAFIVSIAILVCISGAFAQAPLLVEDFNSSAGTLITAAGWTAHSAGGTNAIAVTSPGLTLTGYPGSGVGNAVSMTTSGEDDSRVFAVQSTGSVYAAFLVTVSEAAIDPIGGYFFHFGPDPIGTTFRGRVFIKKDATNAIAFGISKAATAAPDVAFTPFSYSLNTTYLVIVKYTINASTNDDTIALFVSTNVPGSEPAPTVSATDIATQTDINPGAVALRQGSTATAPTVRVDGIRVGTTWASVTTAVAPADTFGDFNGDGRSDWNIVRNTGGGPSGQLTWFTQINGSATTTATPWGINGDAFIPEDFDGDGKDDIAVWRADPTLAYFYILQSSSNTFRAEQFGITGDNARVAGDYDGDGKSDVAVFRANGGATIPDPCGVGKSIWYYRPSGTPGVSFRYECWGKNGDFPAPGDYDGDGKNDYVVQQATGIGSAAVFQLKKSAGGTEQVYWGTTTDVIVQGDYDGDAKTDFCVVRPSGGAIIWNILERDGGGTGASPITWGASATDFPIAGDFDGDGKADITIWRPNAAAGNTFFYVRRSSDAGLTAFQWGQNGDYPVNNAFTN